MASTKKKRSARGRDNRAQRSARMEQTPARGRRVRAQRSDEEKQRIVRLVLASGNQSAEIKKLGIYPNQFYDWKKRFAGSAALSVSARRQPGRPPSGQRAVGAADEAKAFIRGKASLIERLRAQRAELDTLIAQLEQ
jgi:transposase-like protein